MSGAKFIVCLPSNTIQYKIDTICLPPSKEIISSVICKISFFYL